MCLCLIVRVWQDISFHIKLPKCWLHISFDFYLVYVRVNKSNRITHPLWLPIMKQSIPANFCKIKDVAYCIQIICIFKPIIKRRSRLYAFSFIKKKIDQLSEPNLTFSRREKYCCRLRQLYVNGSWYGTNCKVLPPFLQIMFTFF